MNFFHFVWLSYVKKNKLVWAAKNSKKESESQQGFNLFNNWKINVSVIWIKTIHSHLISRSLALLYAPTVQWKKYHVWVSSENKMEFIFPSKQYHVWKISITWYLATDYKLVIVCISPSRVLSLFVFCGNIAI